MLPVNDIVDGGEMLSQKETFEFKKPLVILLIVGCVFAIALGIGLGISIFSPRNVVIVPQPTPTNEPYVTKIPDQQKSKLATDSAILQLKSDLENYRMEQNALQLIDPHLVLPALDLNLSIE